MTQSAVSSQAIRASAKKFCRTQSAVGSQSISEEAGIGCNLHRAVTAVSTPAGGMRQCVVCDSIVVVPLCPSNSDIGKEVGV